MSESELKAQYEAKLMSQSWELAELRAQRELYRGQARALFAVYVSGMVLLVIKIVWGL